MKARTLSAALALGGLMAASGSVLADTAHEAYQRAFFGDSGALQVQSESNASMGKAAYGTAATMPSGGPNGGIVVLTTNGLGRWPDSARPDMAGGKAAFGTGDSGIETGHDGYNRAFYGDAGR